MKAFLRPGFHSNAWSLNRSSDECRHRKKAQDYVQYNYRNHKTKPREVHLRRCPRNGCHNSGSVPEIEKNGYRKNGEHWQDVKQAPPEEPLGWAHQNFTDGCPILATRQVKSFGQSRAAPKDLSQMCLRLGQKFSELRVLCLIVKVEGW